MNNLTTLTAPNFHCAHKGYPSLIGPFNGKNGYADEVRDFPGLIHGAPPAWKKVLRVARETFEKIAKEFYKYLKLASKILKSVLKVVVLVYSEMEEKVGKAIACIGLISIIKPMINAKSFYDNTKELEESIKLKDDVGIAWSSVELFIKPCKIVSGLLSFGKSLDKLVGIPWITLFSAVTVPLAIGLICYDTIKSIYKTIMISIEFSRMPKSAANENYTDFRIYLEKKVGVTPQERKKIEEDIQKKYEIVLQSEKKADVPIVVSALNGKGIIESLEKAAKKEFNKKVDILKDRKIKRLKGHIGKKILKYMVNTKDFLDENPGKQHTAEKALEDMRKLTTRKLTLNVGGSLFCVVEAIMYIVSMIFPSLHAAIPVSFSVAKAIFSICKTTYLDHGMNRGLNNPKFYDPEKKRGLNNPKFRPPDLYA